MKAIGLCVLSFLLATAAGAAVLQSSAVSTPGGDARDAPAGPQAPRPAPMPAPAPTAHYAAWAQ